MDYVLPSSDMLVQQNAAPCGNEDLFHNSRLLESVLDDFEVKGQVVEASQGPVVTVYSLNPEPGTRANKIINIADDLARNMGAAGARISTVSGKPHLGIELPNADRQMISFRAMVESEEFQKSDAALPAILGLDIMGNPVIADLATMPHLLVAGTTGSGKSVGINCILMSLLYKLTPAQCELVLIDPKVLELNTYEGIPHLAAPVITDPQDAVAVLQDAVDEMDRRYNLLAQARVRNIKGYNEKVEELGGSMKVVESFEDEDGDIIEMETNLGGKLSYQVIVIDEFADLMQTAGKEIEGLVQRIAQKARAAGIHLIMATQRPSVDVITGVIKANLPSRISFTVSSNIDSRTIIGENGAEQLLGKGDMLFKANGGPTVRVHGPFVSDDEVEAVTEYWRQQNAS